MIQIRLVSYLATVNHPRPKSLTGFTSVLKKCIPDQDVDEAISLLKKYDLIQINSKRQISYSSILLPN
jgi:hypothetical protein